jgi:hypothetical protein
MLNTLAIENESFYKIGYMIGYEDNIGYEDFGGNFGMIGKSSMTINCFLVIYSIFSISSIKSKNY